MLFNIITQNHLSPILDQRVDYFRIVIDKPIHYQGIWDCTRYYSVHRQVNCKLFVVFNHHFILVVNVERMKCKAVLLHVKSHVLRVTMLLSIKLKKIWLLVSFLLLCCLFLWHTFRSFILYIILSYFIDY